MPSSLQTSAKSSLRAHAWLQAARRSDLAQLEQLIAIDPHLGKHKDSLQKQTALMLAAHQGWTDGVRWLLPHSSAQAKDLLDNTALDLAAQKGHTDCCLLLLEAMPQTPHVFNAALLQACIHQHTDTLLALLARADRSTTVSKRLPLPSLLQAAAAFGSLGCIQVFIERAGDQLDPLEPHEALIVAATNDHVECVRLLSAYCDVSMLGQFDQRNALMAAASSNRTRSVEFLLPLTSLDLRDSLGCTALMLAAQTLHLQSFLTLMERSDLNAQDLHGETALMHAIRADHTANALHLIERCDLTLANHESRTALSVAIDVDNPEVILAIQHRMAQQDRHALNDHLSGSASLSNPDSISLSVRALSALRRRRI